VPSITAAQPVTSITCPNCGKTGSLKSQLPPGTKVRCKGCDRSFEPASEKRGPRQRAGPPGLTLMTGTRLDHARLVVHCCCCGGQVPYPGRIRDGSNPLAECPDCDLYFEVHDRDVFAASTRPGCAPGRHAKRVKMGTSDYMLSTR
jgi:hypothetical protein